MKCLAEYTLTFQMEIEIEDGAYFLPEEFAHNLAADPDFLIQSIKGPGDWMWPVATVKILKGSSDEWDEGVAP